MKILSVNTGSSSLKFQLYNMPEETVLISGVFERIGIGSSFYTIKVNGEKTKKEMDIPTHDEAVKILVQELVDRHIVEDLNEIKGIGHRVVQGGHLFDKTVIVSDDVLEKVDNLSKLAPLHNPAAVVGIKAFKNIIPNAIATVVFDTAFHQTMDEVAYMYALPYEWYTKYNIRKYGAHGTSHKYIGNRLNTILGRTDTKLITCHIGNGASITAIKNGLCFDTSMGFTPNAGLIMGSRCGDIDASIIPYMMEQANISAADINKIINKESGLIAISGLSTDSRDIEDAIILGNEKCILAENMYIRRIIEYIAKYYVLMGGADAIAFSAGVGENSKIVREGVIKGLAVLGVVLDPVANTARATETLITTPNSKIPCYIIPTDEEVMIARDTYELVK